MRKPSLNHSPPSSLKPSILTDGSCNSRSCGAEVVLERPGDVLLKQALKLESKTSNNQTGYEAIIVSLNLVLDLEVKKLICSSDSQLVGQLKGEFKVKESFLRRYYHFVHNLIAKDNETAYRPVSSYWLGSLSLRIYSVALKMYLSRPNWLCHARDTRGGMWYSLEGKNNGRLSIKGKLLLVDCAGRLYKFCSTMCQVSGIR